MIGFFLVLLGLEFGSFANVCIYRWPRGHSTRIPSRSLCPWCETKIVWWQNLPVISFLFLRGRCANCSSAISTRYPIIEVLVPSLWLVWWWLQPAFPALP